jgi:drug/metabolite transporter (DMT)-like permease
VAPLDYTTMIWAFILGYWMFGEVPSLYVYVGAAILAASGIFVIWRERQLGLQRVHAPEGPPAAT